jgi:hypothetical protein
VSAAFQEGAKSEGVGREEAGEEVWTTAGSSFLSERAQDLNPSVFLSSETTFFTFDSVLYLG